MPSGENIVQNVSRTEKKCLSKQNIWTSKVAVQEMFEHLQTLWHTLWLTNDLAIDNPFWLWNWSNFTTKRFSLEKGPDAGNVYQSWRSWKTKIFLILCIITPRGLRPDMFGCNPDIQTLQLRKITSNSFHRGSFWRNSLFRKGGIVPEIKWEARGCKLMEIGVAGMRARTWSENLAEAEHGSRDWEALTPVLEN